MEADFKLIEVFNDPEKGFKGNISAVVMLNEAIDDQSMQRIARDLNQPATTFLWPETHEQTYTVRWFAPDAEIGLCGHGSLAAFAFLGNLEADSPAGFKLNYRDGQITGNKGSGNEASMILQPIPVISEEEVPEILRQGLGVDIAGYFSTDNKQIVLLNKESDLRNMKPDFAKLRESETFGYAVTAPGDEANFVSRTLVPHVQQLEDHATGSSHAALTPFWAQRLKKSRMTAYQLSPRGGKFICEMTTGNVKLSGNFSELASGRLLV